jgi:hypothetical protein
MHLIGSGLKPFEKSPHTIKLLCPLDYGSLLLFYETPKWDVHRNLFAPAKGLHIPEFPTLVVPTSPRLNSTFIKGEGCVWNNEVEININCPSKSTARITGSCRAVKGEEIGQGRAVGDLARGAFKPVAEGKVAVWFDPEINPAFSKAKGLFQGIHNTFSIRLTKQNPVCNDMEYLFAFSWFPVIQKSDSPLCKKATETHPLQFHSELIRGSSIHRSRKRDNHLCSMGEILQCIPDMLWGFCKNGPVTVLATELPQTGIE